MVYVIFAFYRPSYVILLPLNILLFAVLVFTADYMQVFEGDRTNLLFFSFYGLLCLLVFIFEFRKSRKLQRSAELIVGTKAVNDLLEGEVDAEVGLGVASNIAGRIHLGFGGELKRFIRQMHKFSSVLILFGWLLYLSYGVAIAAGATAQLTRAILYGLGLGVPLIVVVIAVVISRRQHLENEEKLRCASID